jgi:hypothetical protein
MADESAIPAAQDPLRFAEKIFSSNQRPRTGTGHRTPLSGWWQRTTGTRRLTIVSSLLSPVFCLQSSLYAGIDVIVRLTGVAPL